MRTVSQEIEIEFKNMLTKEEFTLLKDYLNLSESMFHTQENHYFDTSNFYLKELGCALRIRMKNNKYEVTLKEPLETGLLETNQQLNTKDAEKMMQHGIIIEGPVKDQLSRLNIPLDKLEYFGSLTTSRAEKKYDGGLIVLDHSSYLNKEDYELEYEVEDFETGQKRFHHLLKKLNIPIRKSDNKIQRFYHAKYRNE